MEQHYHTFIVKISDGANKLPRGYVVDNTSQDRGYFEGFPVLEEFILAHLNPLTERTVEPEHGDDK